jgi:hypothetical protein
MRPERANSSYVRNEERSCSKKANPNSALASPPIVAKTPMITLTAIFTMTPRSRLTLKSTPDICLCKGRYLGDIPAMPLQPAPIPNRISHIPGY